MRSRARSIHKSDRRSWKAAARAVRRELQYERWLWKKDPIRIWMREGRIKTMRWRKKMNDKGRVWERPVDSLDEALKAQEFGVAINKDGKTCHELC
jgi:hypothetical protein